MKKVLMLTNVASMIVQFNMRNIKLFQQSGYKVYVACNFEEGNTCNKEVIDKLKNELNRIDVNYYQVDFGRNIQNPSVFIKAYEQTKYIVKQEKFDVIFCQSTLAGIIGRILGYKYNCKVIYIVHGFQFYPGASKIRWLTFYTVEKYLSKKTDCLILTNYDDFTIAKRSFKAHNIFYVQGVGIELEKYKRNEINGKKIRKELGFSDDDFVLFSAGELSERKNHRIVMDIIKQLNNSKIKYIICGIGALENDYKAFIQKNGLEKQIYLLGYREDLVDIYSAANLFIFPSFYEGLPVSLMIAMATKTPIVCSKIRGNTDLIDDNLYMFDPHSQDSIKKTMLNAIECKNLDIVQTNYNKVLNFSDKAVDKRMLDIIKNIQ